MALMTTQQAVPGGPLPVYSPVASPAPPVSARRPPPRPRLATTRPLTRPAPGSDALRRTRGRRRRSPGSVARAMARPVAPCS